MSARITINLTAMGELEIWVNEKGRDLLIRELQRLNDQNDHFHFGPKETGEVVVSSIGYRPNDKLLEHGKVLFRTDAWDREYYPHVLKDSV